MKLAYRGLRFLAKQLGYELLPLPVTRKKPKIKLSIEDVSKTQKPVPENPRDEAFSWELLHAVDPYEGFDHEQYPVDARGWGSESEVFEKLILQTKPKLILEVGTWKGASAIEMADILDRHDLDCKIVCIDTWLGALEFWTDQSDLKCFGSLRLKHGYPTVYYQFLANVKRANHHKRIVPFPQTSAIAGSWFRFSGIKAQLIYIDGSHAEEDVYHDLVAYSQCLDDDGILFGDDYPFDSVRSAVDRFASENKQFKIEVEDGKWWFRTQSSAITHAA